MRRRERKRACNQKRARSWNKPLDRAVFLFPPLFLQNPALANANEELRNERTEELEEDGAWDKRACRCERETGGDKDC
jgi:hypothetical protein